MLNIIKNQSNIKLKSVMLAVLGYLMVVKLAELSADSFEDFCNQMNNLFDARCCDRLSLWDEFKVDIKSTKNEYVIEVEIPGVKKSEIDLNVEDQMLCISVNREKKVSDKKNDDLHRERHDSAMERSICLRDADFNHYGRKAKKSDDVRKITIE